MSRKLNVNATVEDFGEVIGGNVKRKPTAKRPTRAVKETAQSAPRGKGLNDFVLTAAQKNLINKIRENVITFVDAEAGTGKSSAVLHHFCKEYLLDKQKQIVVIRTPVEAGPDKIGFLPSDLASKCAPHFSSSKVLLEQFLGKGVVETDMDHRIFFRVPNFCLGATYDNALILIDEAQQLQPIILKLLLERIGLNTKVVVAGCSSQLYLKDKDRNALADAIKRFFVEDNGEKCPKYRDMAYHEFDIEECHRADVVKDIIRGYRGS
jgi:phosphate starvation-inducible PhoH-like protein